MTKVANRVNNRKCSVCGDDTTLVCSDCAIDYSETVYVCLKSDCRDKHEL